MTRDYKNAGRSADKPLPGWIWLLTGLTMGLAVALVVYLNQPRVAPAEPQTAADVFKHEPRSADPNRERATPSERRFDFYTLLPELEVVVPEEQSQPSPAPRGAPSQPPQTTTASGPYVLQAGSFQRAEEADTLKANLALLGVEADIQKVTVDDSTWHRVRVGPYEDLAELNRVRDRLTRNRIDTVVLKERR